MVWMLTLFRTESSEVFPVSIILLSPSRREPFFLFVTNGPSYEKLSNFFSPRKSLLLFPPPLRNARVQKDPISGLFFFFLAGWVTTVLFLSFRILKGLLLSRALDSSLTSRVQDLPSLPYEGSSAFPSSESESHHSTSLFLTDILRER